MYLEAMAAGKIVIASNTGAPKEYIKNNKNGFIIPLHNPQKLADLLEKIFNSKEIRHQISNQAHIDAQKYTSQKMINSIEKVYKKLLLF